MVDCSNKNIHIFFKYVKGELTRKEEYSIDHHLQNCEDCLFNFAYVEEIYTKKHLLSSDEKTLFIKCLSDPLWNSEIEKIKKGIRQELYEEIENLSSVKNKSIDRSDNKTNIAEPDVVLTSVKLRPNDSNVVGFNRENTNYKRYSSFSRINKYLVAAASIVIFAGLSTSVYLIINKATNQSLSLSRPTSSFSSPSTNINSNSPIYNIYNKITNNKPKSASTNLYQELDLAIDEYLEHQDISYINKAREIATDIDTKYGDKYGVDLVRYYQEFNTPTLKKAQTDSHKKLLEIFDRISADNYQQRLEEAQKLEKQFIALENFIEAQKTKIIISKLCVQLYKYDQADLFVQQGKKFATDKNYIFLETHFLLCQAKRLSQIPDFINAEKIFLEAIDLGNKLQLLKVVKSAGMSLATLYYRNDKNEEAFELAEKLLLVFPDYGNSQSIALLQIAGLSSFNLGKHQLANSYLKQAIEHSITLKNPALVSRSYAFLSLILCEQKRFDQANNFFLLAESELNKVEDQTVRLELLSIIVGYKAKAMLLKNEYEKALELYQQKLSLLEQLKLENNLETSQVNEAMAIALTALGQKEKAQNYTAIAKYYKNLAEANNEKTNCLLSLLPTNCVSRK